MLRCAVRLAPTVALAVFAHGTAAQTVGGGLSGVVTDATGGVVRGAMIVLRHVDSGGLRHVVSDEDGHYRLPALPAGDYRLGVEAPGFASRQEQLQIGVGETVYLDLRLELAAGHQEVQVTGSLIQRETTELGGRIERRQVLDLPVNGRSYEQLALLEPGVAATTNRETNVLYLHGLKVNINGAGSRSNAFLLDGTSVTDAYNNGLGSVAGTFLGVEAVREFQVVTNSYSAAYGGAGGGVVSIVTRSGGDVAHGSAFGLLRDDNLEARSYFDTEKPDFTRRQFGVAAGGAVLPSRVHYFAAGEWLRESLGLTQPTTVPSLEARRGELPDPARPGSVVTVNPAVEPFLQLFPLPNGRDFGGGLAEHTFSATRRTVDSFGQVRLDARLGANNTLFGRFTLDRASKTEPARYPGLEVDWDSKSDYVTLEDAHVISGAAVNTFRFSYSLTDLVQVDSTSQTTDPALSVIPGRSLPHLVIGGMPTFGSLVSPYTRARQRLFAVANDVTLARGRHLLKAGLLLERYRALLDFQFFWNGRYTFPSIREFLQGRPSVLSVALPGSESARDLFITQFGLYLQDDIRLSSKVTLNAGLRWEFSTNPREAQDRLVALVDPLNDAEVTVGTLLQTQKGNVAPRVGLSWTPGDDGHTVLRAGAGLFYEVNTLPYNTQTVGTNPPFFEQVTVVRPGFPQPNLPPGTVLSLSVPRFDWRTPRFVHYNVAVERELPGRTSVTLAYAGSRGLYVVRSGDLNAPVPETLPDGTRVFPSNAPRRNPNFGAISYRTPDGDSSYHALQVKATRRMHDGLQYQVGYTLSRVIDQTQGTVPTEALGSVTQWMDPDLRDTDRGPADFDRRHNLTASFIWDPPFFKAGPAAVRTLFGNWTISGILALRSGNPFTVGIQADYSRTLARVSVDRPNLGAGVDADDVVLGGPEQYFDPHAFELQAPGTFGNVGRSSLVGPGLATLDLALMKSFDIPWRQGTIQLRLEGFNVLNHVNFGLPQRIVFAGARPDEAPLPTAGRITSTTTGARQVQVGLRLLW